MSISRAFTTRRVKQSLDLRDAAEGLVSRSNTSNTKSSKTPKSLNSIRNKISAPVELVSTTNMLSYNAPDIFPKSAVSPSTSATRSDDDSDSAHSIASTPPTSPDSPHPKKRTAEPELEPNHLSCYFTAPGQALAGPSSGDAPAIPQRAPSHTKKHSQEALTRQRSNSRMSEQSSRTLSSKASFTFSRSSTSTNTSSVSHSSTPYTKTLPPVSLVNQMTPLATPPMAPVSHRREPSGAAHPFGHELAQVSELAEEYSTKESSVFCQQEDHEILSQGYMKLSPQDYLSEVQDLYTIFFGEEKPSRPVWI